MTTKFKKNKFVSDRWWSWKIGRVVRQTVSTVTVQWDDGKIWKYDRQHLQFLEATR